MQSPRSTGRTPTGRRFYVVSRTDVPLVFAVFIQHQHDSKPRRYPPGTWERIQVIEDRTYPDEPFYEEPNGTYRNTMDMTPARKAEEVATWYRQILKLETVVVPLTPAPPPASKKVA